MTKIILHGCNGRMGRVITALVKEEADLTIVAGVDADPEAESGYPVYPALTDVKEEADVVIDFSVAAATDALLDGIAAKKLPLVLCTTGLSGAQLARVTELSAEIAILRSANMSLGINTLIKALRAVTPVLAASGFDMEIVEAHHNQKLDAPSGTAVMLADTLREAADGDYTYMYDRTQVRRKRDPREIGIQAVRGGTIVGDHDVIFAGTDEVITFSHRAYSRAIFGKGAIAAARFLQGKAPGMYDMGDVV